MCRPFVPKACRFQLYQSASVPSAANCPHSCPQASTASAMLLLYGAVKGCFSSPPLTLFPAREQLPRPMPRLGAARSLPRGQISRRTRAGA